MLPYKVKGKKILFYPGCKRVFEYLKNRGGEYKKKVYQGPRGGVKPKYYPGLFSYGLIREICPECVSRAIKEVKKKRLNHEKLAR